MQTKNISHRRPRTLWALLVAVALFVLTACGATVDTTLNLNNNATSGTRVMDLTIDDTEQSAEYIKGGLPAVEASIQKNLPEGIQFSGIQQSGKKATGSFTITFTSIDDYTKKVEALLAASGDSTTPSITIADNDQGLVTGTTIEENFTSIDLLGWVPDALVADGVIEESDKSNVFTSGKNTILLDGKKVEDESSGEIRFDNVKDNGVDNVYAVATVADDGRIQGDVILGGSEPLGSVKTKKVEEYLAAANLGDGAKVEDQNGSVPGASSDVYGKKVSFESADFAEYSTMLQKILGSKRNKIEYSAKTAKENSASIATNFKGTLECTAVCSPDGNKPVFILQAPGNWTWVSGGNASESYGVDSGQTVATSNDTSFNMQFQYTIPLKTASVETTRSLGGTIDQVWNFTVDTKAAETTAGGFERFLTPEEGKGSIESSESDGVTTYKVTISGDNPQDFNDKLAAYIPGAHYTEERPSGFHFWPGYNVEMYLPATESKLAGGVTDGYSYKYTLPALNKFDESSQTLVPEGVQVDGKTVSAEQKTMTDQDITSNMYLAAKGPTLGSLIGLIVVLALVAIAALLAFIFRRKLSDSGKKAWAKRGSVAAATSAGVGAASAAARNAGGHIREANQQASHYSEGGTAPLRPENADQATWRDRFSENDIS